MTGISVKVNYDDAEYVGTITPLAQDVIAGAKDAPPVDAKVGGRAQARRRGNLVKAGGRTMMKQKGGVNEALFTNLQALMSNINQLINAFERMQKNVISRRFIYKYNKKKRKISDKPDLEPIFNRIINQRNQTLIDLKQAMVEANKITQESSESDMNKMITQLTELNKTGRTEMLQQVTEQSLQSDETNVLPLPPSQLTQLPQSNATPPLPPAAAQVMSKPSAAAANGILMTPSQPPPFTKKPETTPVDSDPALVQSTVSGLIGQPFKWQKDPQTGTEQLKTKDELYAEVNEYDAASTSHEISGNIADSSQQTATRGEDAQADASPKTAMQGEDAQADASLVKPAIATQQEDKIALRIKIKPTNEISSEVAPHDTSSNGQTKLKAPTITNNRNSSVSPATNVIGTDIQRDSAFQDTRLSTKTKKPLTIEMKDVKLLPVANPVILNTSVSAQKTPYDEPAKTIKLTATLKGITHDGILKRNITLKNRLSSVSRASTDGFKKSGNYIADKAIKARDGIADKARKAVELIKIKPNQGEEGEVGGKTRNKRQHPRRRITYKNNNKTHPKQSMKKATKKATNKSMKKSMKKATK